MPADKCLIVILGKVIEFQMTRNVPVSGIQINDEFFKPIQFEAEDYFFDWLIDKNENVIGVRFFDKHILSTVGSFPKYENMEFEEGAEWTSIYFSHKTEFDSEQSVAQQDLNTYLLKSEKNRFALTFPVYDYDLSQRARQSIDERFILKET